MTGPVLATVAALLGATAQQGGADSSVTVRPIRFYSRVSGSTVIEGTSEIRLAGLASPAGPTTRYRVEVAIADSNGLELYRSDWTRELPTEAARTAGATAAETFRFAAAPGRYRVLVRASADGRPTLEQAVTIAAFPDRPLLSDLLLATAARETADTASLAPGEVRRGRWALQTAPQPHLSLTEAALTYYAEIYPWQGYAGGEGRLALEVVSDAGRSLVRIAPQVLRVGASGGVARGTMDLAGLPVGSYRLRGTLTLGDSSQAVEAGFEVGPPRAAPAVAAAPAGPFDDANETVLDSMYAPLIYLMQDNERGVYENLTVDGKRRYLNEFWSRRDPTPQTPDNPLRDVYYRGVRHANGAFREGGAAQIPGWRTDRGRIYLKYGEPDDALRRPMASPRPYEVWVFTQHRRVWYVFLDRTGLGHYELIGTNDLTERTVDANWQYLLGPDGFRDVSQFLQG
jgi:GWxTD domain-containing protein